MINIKTIILVSCWALITSTEAFSVTRRSTNYSFRCAQHPSIISSPFGKNNNGDLTTRSKLNLSPLDEDEVKNVNVNLVGDVDSFTLTAIGFGLIAFNFFVFANMGDAGVGGIVARLINAFS